MIRYNFEGQFTNGNDYSYTEQFFFESFEINNKIYYDVVDYIKVEHFAYYDERMAKDSLPIRLLCNKTEGLLQFVDKYKLLFTIAN